MLEGHQKSETKFSEFVNDKERRLEAEYWNKKSSISIEAYKGEDIIEFVQYGTSAELNEFKSGYPVLRLNEFNSFFIGVPEKYCDLLSDEEFENYRLLKGDVLICRTNGNPNLVGRAAIVQDDTDYAYASYLFKIRPKKELINSATLVSFLRSKYGRNEIDAYSMVGNQTNFSPAKFREIDIPKFSNPFNTSIQEAFQYSYSALTKSEALYQECEAILLGELGLNLWRPIFKNNNPKTFKESFLRTGRLDAEYYQSKYDQIEGALKIYTEGCSTVGASVISVDTGEFSSSYKAKEERLRFYIRNTNIHKCQIREDQDYFVDPTHFSKFTEEGDILTARVGAIGSFGVINNEFAGSVYSDNVLCLKLRKGLLPDVYVCYFNSKVNNELMDKIAGGSVQPLITQTSIKELLIPIFPQKLQKIVSAKIQESFQLKKVSENLLDAAKRAVEIAIEFNEKTALEYLTKFTYA